MSAMVPMPEEQPEAKTIEVEFQNGEIRVNPEEAYVSRRERVRWHVVADHRVRIEVYFDHGSPFKRHVAGATTTDGEIDMGSANEPGDYKYGVRVKDPSVEKTLADDDPRLIVSP